MKRLLYRFHVDFKDRSKNVFGNSFDRVSIGEYWNISSFFAQQYCKKYDVEYKFEFLKEKEYTPWAFGVETFDKYRAIQYLKEYDQVLYVDTDVIINPNSDNIFEEFLNLGLVCYFDVVADKYIHKDNTLFGKLNSGVILYNNNARHIKGKNFLYNMDILSANWPSKGTMSEKNILKKYAKGKWWEYWEEKHRENIVFLKGGTPSDENFLHFIINLYVLLPFHIGRKYNYIKGSFTEMPITRGGKIDTPNFIHYEGASKKLMIEDAHEFMKLF